ncbi:Glycerophosphoryl diester phosphodiesterase [Butyrivibrio sp. ob235]|uniref:glycerophosphodiester phosphodiesterase family protein n=1 Tax=Butyrivibrio sp. ob235 TaxID=1761780 RepID=UPI0008C5DE76|nr:glycerophosphodiester phosphodiesterase family protein [Butyrivibrio sp. ob235]SEM26751.1 Glycerophosphoryl diester phosphodiesterase [Butyrivibrio sp. ob235]
MKRTTLLTLIFTTLILLLTPITASAQTYSTQHNSAQTASSQEASPLATTSTTVKSVSHRGYNTVAPENTLPAYELSCTMGFHYVEADISFTSDGVPVLLHDETLNRTARHPDGTQLLSTISISDITYDELLQYDFGIWKSTKYARTKISTFEDFLTLCKTKNLHPYIELKDNGDYQASQINLLVDMVKHAGLEGHVTWISFNSEFLAWVKAKDAHARLGYVVYNISGNEQTIINTAINLRSESNDIFLDLYFRGVSDKIVELSKNNNFPIEVWTINTVDEIKKLNPYISGITTNKPKYEEALQAQQNSSQSETSKENKEQAQEKNQNQAQDSAKAQNQEKDQPQNQLPDQTQDQTQNTDQEKSLNQNAELPGFNSNIKITQPNNKLKVSWTKKPGLCKYAVYAAYMDKNFTAKPTKTTTSTSVTIKKLNGKKLNSKKNYKIYIVAYDKRGKVAGKSVISYVAGKNSKKYTNPKSIDLSIGSATLIPGSSITVNAKIKLEKGNLKPLPNTKVAKYRYVSSDPNVATVSNSGTISAAGNGSCHVYVYSANGLSERIAITVND